MTKSQMTSTKTQTSPNIQIPSSYPLGFEYWSLAFVCDLEFKIWSLRSYD